MNGTWHTAIEVSGTATLNKAWRAGLEGRTVEERPYVRDVPAQTIISRPVQAEVATIRLAHDPRTKAYAARRTAEGKTTKEIIRCLKRYIAREIYKTLCRPRQPGSPTASPAKQDLSVPALT